MIYAGSIAKRNALADSFSNCPKVINAESTSGSPDDRGHKFKHEPLNHVPRPKIRGTIKAESTFGSSHGVKYETDDGFKGHTLPRNRSKNIKKEA